MTKTIAKVLIAIMVLSLLTVMFNGCQFVKLDPAADRETVVAEVAGEKIKKGEFLEMFDVIKAQYDMQIGKEVWEQELEGRKYIDIFKERVLDALIDNKIQLNKAKELGIEATQEEVDAEMNKVNEYFNSEEKLNEFLVSRNMTMEYFINSIKTDLTIVKLQEKLTENVQVTDEDAAVYYSTHADEFESIKASHILVDSEDEAKNMKQRLAEGRDFAELAKEFSRDTGTKDMGGDLGFFKRGDMVEVFEKAAFAMQPGQISEPIHSEFGFHIIKLSERKIDKLEEVMESLKNKLLSEKKSTEYNAILDEMRKNSNIKKYVKSL